MEFFLCVHSYKFSAPYSKKDEELLRMLNSLVLDKNHIVKPVILYSRLEYEQSILYFSQKEKCYFYGRCSWHAYFFKNTRMLGEFQNSSTSADTNQIRLQLVRYSFPDDTNLMDVILNVGDGDGKNCNSFVKRIFIFSLLAGTLLDHYLDQKDVKFPNVAALVQAVQSSSLISNFERSAINENYVESAVNLQTCVEEIMSLYNEDDRVYFNMKVDDVR